MGRREDKHVRVQALLGHDDDVPPDLLILEQVDHLGLFPQQGILPYVGQNVPDDAAHTKNVVFADKSENIFKGLLVFYFCVIPAMIFGK